MIEMDIGTWNQTKLTAAYWSTLICSTEGEFKVSEPVSSGVIFLIIGSMTVVLAVGFISHFASKNSKQKSL